MDLGSSTRNAENDSGGVGSAALERDGSSEPRLGERSSTGGSAHVLPAEDQRHQQGGWSQISGSLAATGSGRRRNGSTEGGKLFAEGTTVRSEREDQQQQRPRHSSPASSKSSNTPTANKLHHHPHPHHRQQPKPPGVGTVEFATPSRVPSERSPVDFFDNPSSGGIASAAVTALSGGGSSSGGGSRSSAPSTPPGGLPPARSSLVNAGTKARGAGRASPSVSSTRSISPGRRNGGGDGGSGGGSGGGGGGGGVGVGGSSPKKAARRSNDSSQTLGRKSVDSQGGVSHNFKVVIRVRPPLPREVEGERMFQNIVSVDKEEHVITISENLNAVLDDVDGSVVSAGGPYSTHAFTFDHVYDVSASQRKVYDTTAMEVVDSSLQGYNATVFAYGQTVRDSHCHVPFDDREPRTPQYLTHDPSMIYFSICSGVRPHTEECVSKVGNWVGPSTVLLYVPVICARLSRTRCQINPHGNSRMRFLVRASYLQIYNEQISDLLKPERNNLTIREDKKRGVFVEGLSEWVVSEMDACGQAMLLLWATSATRMNDTSSRSHAVFIIIVEQSETSYTDEKGEKMSPETLRQLLRKAGSQEREALLRKLETNARQTFKVGKLNLVDLAGSERVRLSGATGQRLRESKKINQSLSALGNVISALTDHRGRQHIPYRDSKLTRILEDSLGGNCKTTMMAMISPALESMVETLSTVKFASRAKNIKNQPIVNEDFDQKVCQKQTDSLLRKYERELKRLRAELEERSRNLVDKRQLLFVEGERRRAEADKMAAIRALETAWGSCLQDPIDLSRTFVAFAYIQERSLEFQREKEEKRLLEGRIAMLTGQMIGRGRRSDGGAEGVDYADRLADLERERNTIELEKEQVERYKQLLMKQRDIMIALTQRLNERDDALIEDALDMRTQQLFHLQKALVMHGGNGAEGGNVGDDQVCAAASDASTIPGHSGRSNLDRRTLDGWIDSPGATAAATKVAAGSDKFLSVRPALHNRQQQQQQHQQRPSTAPQSSSSFSSGKSSNVNFEAPEPLGGRRCGDAGVSSSTTPTELHYRSVSGNTIFSPNGSTTKGSATPAAVFGGREEAHNPPLEEELISFPRFKPHALMQPTLFSTDDPAGGVSFHDGGILSREDGEQGGEGDRGGGGGGAGRGEALKRAGVGGAKLLNAWEKIEELEGLVESSRSHNERLLKDLEEVQTDKVSMEYLLREKLERLVQSEIEARVARMHQIICGVLIDGVLEHAQHSALTQRPLTERQGPEDEIATEVLARTTQELEELRCENAELRKQMLAPALRREDANTISENREAGKEGEDDRSSVAHGSAQDAALQNRCEALLGERKAMQASSETNGTKWLPTLCRILTTTTAPYNEARLPADVVTSPRALAFLCQTIMEQKVKVLVDNVADSACAVLDLVAASQSGADNHRAGDGYSGSTDHAQVVLPSPSLAPAGGTESAAEGEVSRAGTESSSSPAAREAAGRALSKDVGQLRRLVQAAITALRNADAEDQQRGITATASSPHSEEHDRKT
ncbi:unnamed protein product [Ectocarpus sp. CCAP 1310/34]|nr:unnamed protein product [Ectocarpus sp. CCAP 1310/34]